MTTNTKICGRCRNTKPLTEFNKSSKSTSGVHCLCRSCVNVDRKSRRMQDVTLTDSDIERFNKYASLDTDKGYLVWKGIKDKDGYGLFNVRERLLKAHRVAWMIKNGPIPPGMCVLHRNDDPECVDINYLFLGTIIENNLDKKLKGRGVVGERNGKAVLSEEQVMDVINLRNSGLTLEKISKDIGISLSGVHHICSGYTWSHLTKIPYSRQ